MLSLRARWMTDVSLATGPQNYRGLDYPLGRRVPEDGALQEVADGVFWLRMPLPFSLNHINLWVLDDGDAGWALVDTGLNAPACKDHWRALFAGPLAGKPVSRVIVTHYHPDHLGLGGWLTHKHGVPLEMTRGEFMLARVLTLDIRDTPPEEAIAFYARSGWPDAAMERLRARNWGGFAQVVSRLPTGFVRLADGDTLRIGGRDWRILVGSGHSPEHACLVCDEAGLLISGDQVLPRITSNVSVYPTEPGADPLGEWLASIEKLRTLPDTTLVLPAHNEPFTRLHTRLDQLRDDHMKKLAALAAVCTEPRSAFESFAAIFGRPIKDDEMMMATGEALAHLHWLERQGQLTRLPGEVERFVAA